jgi:O-methyltransferase
MRLGSAINKIGLSISRLPRLPLYKIYRKYRLYTMVNADSYVRSLVLAKVYRGAPGSVVECGVWKGGMSAGMAEVVGPDRNYYLFDSFEGCPRAQEIDGPRALEWQNDVTSPHYRNNSSADIGFCQEAMKKAGAARCTIVKGWFDKTLPGFKAEGGIAVLRLDGDWYESTMTCLHHLFPQVNCGGVVIIDDYYSFEGCTRAVHEYLSQVGSTRRIKQLDNDVCFIVNAD